MSELQRVTSPANCFILGAVHPPNALKSLKACTLSQCAYHRGTDPAEAQALLLPKIPLHMTADEQMPGVLPRALIALMVSVRKAQLLLASWPDQEQPELGLVSTSIHTVVQRLLETPLISSLTCEVAFLPLHGNMQTSVDRPAVRALLRLLLALASRVPEERYARTMANEFPAFLRQVKVAAEVGFAISMPLTDRPTVTSMATSRMCVKPISFYYQSYKKWLAFPCLYFYSNNKRMSQFGTYSHSSSQLSEPLPSRSKFQAQESAMELMERVIDRAIHHIVRGERLRENLKHFSKLKTINNINEVNRLNFYHSQVHLPSLPRSQQPTPLYVDSLLPISADIDRTNPYKLALSKMGSSQVSDTLRIRRDPPSKIEAKEKYLKLSGEGGEREEEEDGFTKQLRKMQQERESKVRNQQKVREQLVRQQRQKLKQKKKEKEERVSFDYSGLPIKIRSDSRANLISKLINGAMNPKTHLDRQAFNDPNPSTVDSVVLGKKKNSLAAIKKRDEVEFQQNRSLSEGVSVGAGVKYTYDGKTLQLKKKAVSTIELKKTLTSRRLNKQQYQRVRSLNGSSLQLGPSQSDFRQTGQKRSQSQAHLKKKGPAVPKQKIIVNNQNLREKMLERVNELMMETMREEDNPETKYEYVGQVDIFNMNYLKNGLGDTKSDRKAATLSTERSLTMLPRLAKMDNGKASLPKERERIKEINTVIYEIRKKFDQKLQY